MNELTKNQQSTNQTQKFDFDSAVKELLAGKKISGKDGVLAPLVKQLVEAALEAEVESHIANDVLSGNKNRRNGYNTKTIKSATDGAFELSTPRDRESTFEPQIVKKYQTTISDEIEERTAIDIEGAGRCFDRFVACPGGFDIVDGIGEAGTAALRGGKADARDRAGGPGDQVRDATDGASLTEIVGDLQRAVAQKVKLPPGISVAYTGQFEFLERATQRLKIVVPAPLLIIFALHYATFRRWDEAALIMATLPFALTGGVWLLYLLGYNQSVATGVGFIALAGVAAEFGVVMLIYLKHALAEHSPEDVEAAVRQGALLRVRPKAMTVAVILAGLFPILIGTGTGSEVMSRIAAPMIGGMLTAPLLSMLIIPAAYLLMRRRTQVLPKET